MNSFLLLRFGGRRLCSLWLGLLLLGSTASVQAYFLFPQFLVVTFGETAIIHVNGPPGGKGAINIMSVIINNPSVASYMAPSGLTGMGTVPIAVTGTGTGTTSMSFSGTYSGGLVNASAMIFVVPKIGTVGQNPLIFATGEPISTSTGEYFGREAIQFRRGKVTTVSVSNSGAVMLAGKLATNTAITHSNTLLGTTLPLFIPLNRLRIFHATSRSIRRTSSSHRWMPPL